MKVLQAMQEWAKVAVYIMSTESCYPAITGSKIIPQGQIHKAKPNQSYRPLMEGFLSLSSFYYIMGFNGSGSSITSLNAIKAENPWLYWGFALPGLMWALTLSPPDQKLKARGLDLGKMLVRSNRTFANTTLLNKIRDTEGGIWSVAYYLGCEDGSQPPHICKGLELRYWSMAKQLIRDWPTMADGQDIKKIIGNVFLLKKEIKTLNDGIPDIPFRYDGNNSAAS